MNTLHFNPKPPTIIHLDLNSCFASIEQQANPHLRGKPVAVAAYTTTSGCIIAPSVEAKKLGIKVGMRVKDGRLICPDLAILAPDPWKYRFVHTKLRELLSQYTNDLTPKSIDEFVLDLEGMPCLAASSMEQVARQIKNKIKEEIGDWLTVSVGISTNRFLAKLAAGLHKPDGLDIIDKNNFLDCYLKLELTDFPYIKLKNAARLNNMGIFTVLDFYNAPLWKLKAAFQSINGYYWFLRLHGFEIDDIEFGRKSYGNSYALPKPFYKLSEITPILSKLAEKTGFRLRRAGFKTRGIHLAVSYRDGDFWHKGSLLEEDVFDSRDIYKKVVRLFCAGHKQKPVRDLAISCFCLTKSEVIQLDIFSDSFKKKRVVEAVDKINGRWGNFAVSGARMALVEKGTVPDRVAFGGVKELEELVVGETKVTDD